MSDARSVVEQFVACINAHQVDGIASLLSPQHRFIDSLGTVVTGRETMRNGWREYFRMVPDYRLSIAHVFSDGAQVLLVGEARGTYTRDGTLKTHNVWSTPVACRAVVSNALISEWQVYADNEPMRRCMRASC
jgi:ketosteroid isomerase-like protein